MISGVTYTGESVTPPGDRFRMAKIHWCSSLDLLLSPCIEHVASGQLHSCGCLLLWGTVVVRIFACGKIKTGGVSKCPRNPKDLIIAALVLDACTSSATMKDYSKYEHKRLASVNLIFINCIDVNEGPHNLSWSSTPSKCTSIDNRSVMILHCTRTRLSLIHI